MLTKKELKILETGVLYEVLEQHDRNDLTKANWEVFIKERVVLFNEENKTNLNPDVMLENYKWLKNSSLPVSEKKKKTRKQSR